MGPPSITPHLIPFSSFSTLFAFNSQNRPHPQTLLSWHMPLPLSKMPFHGSWIMPKQHFWTVVCCHCVREFFPHPHSPCLASIRCLCSALLSNKPQNCNCLVSSYSTSLSFKQTLRLGLNFCIPSNYHSI